MTERRPSPLTRPSSLALAIGLISLLAIGGAWAFQWAGYAPCELCLKERIPHYAGIPLAVLTAALAARGRASLATTGFLGLLLVYGAGAVLSGYHAGVEWHLWAGPASCTGSYAAPSDVSDFLHQLQTTNVVRCDAPALRVLGLSLAVWDCIVCLGLTAMAAAGLATGSRAASR
jgi:disulfide bond formation protein DsbB